MVVQAEQKDSDEKIVEIELERLRTFVNHPFHVEMDGQMKELQDSIKKYGIITPIIVRPRKEGFYEIISGHRCIFRMNGTPVSRKRCGGSAPTVR